MAERAALYGGRVDRRLEGGLHVLAVHLPLVDERAAPVATGRTAEVAG
jgi:hypothetical protein